MGDLEWLKGIISSTFCSDAWAKCNTSISSATSACHWHHFISRFFIDIPLSRSLTTFSQTWPTSVGSSFPIHLSHLKRYFGFSCLQTTNENTRKKASRSPSWICECMCLVYCVYIECVVGKSSPFSIFTSCSLWHSERYVNERRLFDIVSQTKTRERYSNNKIYG